MENKETNRLLKSINNKLGFFVWLTLSAVILAVGAMMIKYL